MFDHTISWEYIVRYSRFLQPHMQIFPGGGYLALLSIKPWFIISFDNWNTIQFIKWLKLCCTHQTVLVHSPNYLHDVLLTYLSILKKSLFVESPIFSIRLTLFSALYSLTTPFARWREMFWPTHYDAIDQ